MHVVYFSFDARSDSQCPSFYSGVGQWLLTVNGQENYQVAAFKTTSVIAAHARIAVSAFSHDPERTARLPAVALVLTEQ